MGLTRLSVDRPVVILMAIAAILLLGVYGYRHLPADLDPQVDIPVVNIMTVYHGAGPKQVEERVTRPLEDAVASINRVDTVDSTSLEHLSNITVRFREGTDPDAAAAEVKARVEAARADLPPEAPTPIVSKVDVNAQPVMILGVSFAEPPRASDETDLLRQLRQAAEERVRPKLSQATGVASVKVEGGVEREIQIQADPARLHEAGLSITDLVTSLRASSVGHPAGQVTHEDGQVTIRIAGELNRLQAIRETAILASVASTPRGGAPGPPPSPTPPAAVLVSDVATVLDTIKQPDQIVRIGGKPGVVVQVTRLADANTVQVADRVRTQIAEIQSATPPGQPRLAVATLQDHSDGVRLALEDITLALWLGSLLAVLVVFVFLHSVKDTIIVAIAIPTSIIATFAVIYLVGFTLNQMTMLALSLSVGILVDDSILVLDSIHRHRKLRKSPRDAALDGRQEIGLADATNTLVDVVVFVPVALMGGLIGMYFKQFGLTVAVATLFSMYVSFSLTPMLAARWFRPGEALTPPQTGFFGWFNRSYGRLEGEYRGVLGWALRHRALVVVLGFGSLAVAVSLALTRVGRDFVPSIDRGEVQIALEMQPGRRLEDTDLAMQRIERVVMRPEYAFDIDRQRMYASVGEISGGADRLPERGPIFAELKLQLREKEGVADWFMRPISGRRLRSRSDEEVAVQLRQALSGEPIAHVQRVAVSAVRTVTRARAPLYLTLLGQEGQEASLGQAADEIKKMLAGLEDDRGRGLLVNVDSTYREGLPELRVNLDRARAAELQVTPAEVGQTTRTALEGYTDIRFREGNRVFPVRVKLDPEAVQGREDLENLIVAHRGGSPVYLSEVARVEPADSATRILRRDRRPMVRVTAGLMPGVDLGTAKAKATEGLQALLAQPGEALGTVRRQDLKWGGETEGMSESMRDVAWALVFAIALSYMLMAALFNSFLHPLTIIFSVPMALVGAILALLVTGTSLSVVAMIGVVMLVGLVSKNAILLVDYTNTLRNRDGYPRDEAILQAGPVRLRPILMTTIAMILGMLPVALRIGRASEMRAPMAIVVIGGLILSTLLTLVVIPVVYTYFDDLTHSIQRAWSRRFPAPAFVPLNGSEDGDAGARERAVPEQERVERPAAPAPGPRR